MLHPLILLAFLMFFPVAVFGNCGQQVQSCSVSPLNENIAKDIQSLEQNSTQKIQELLNDKNFQDFVAEIKDKGTSPHFALPGDDFVIQTNLSEPHLLDPTSSYVFVSFSMGEKALLHMAEEAKRWDTVLVLRGFKEGSYKKTVQSLQKIITKTDQGFLIDPELFSLFEVTSVPTIVLSKPIPLLAMDRLQTPIHDRLQGHVSLRYVLEAFAREGDLKVEAQTLLKRGEPK